MIKQTLALLVVLSTSVSIFAQPLDITSREVWFNNTETGEVVFENEVLCRFSAPDDTLSAAQRADNTARQIRQMTALGLDTTQIQLNRVDNRLVATIQGVPLFSVTEKEMDINQTSDVVLAKEWMARFQNVFDKIPGYTTTNYAHSIPSSSSVYAWVKSCELPNQNAPYVASHTEFPTGTTLRLINPDTKWSVVVTIGPRYPIPEGVSMLVSSTTASAIGMPKSQIGRVMVEAVSN